MIATRPRDAGCLRVARPGIVERNVMPRNHPSSACQVNRAALAVCVVFALAVLAPDRASAASEEVTFQAGSYTLYGCIVRPEGDGPFRAVIYNHGSEKFPGRCSPPDLARAYVDHGYMFFMFHRHGHGRSPGEYIMDAQRRIFAEPRDLAARQQEIVALQDTYNLDVAAAVAWLLARPEVDRNHVAMTGVSFGGIQTLLAAEKGLGLRASIPFAPGAMSWANAVVRQRLERAARNAKAPLFLAQAQNDYSLGPSQLLGPLVRAKGPPNDAKVYPAFGGTPQEAHAAFAIRAGGIAVWSSDVFTFLDKAMEP